MSDHATEHDIALAELSALVERRRLDSARQVLARVLPRYPESTALMQFAAWVEWLDDRTDEARRQVDEILERDPGSYEARYLLVQILIEKETYAEAEQVVLELLREYPRTAGLYVLYARIMFLTFNVDKAEDLAAEALRLDPTDAGALDVHVLAGYIAHPAAEQRIRLQKLLLEYPDQLGSIIRLIQSLIGQGKSKQAYALAQDLVRLYPDNDSVIELAASLKRSSHWSLIPLWPMQKWGWAGSIGIWFVVVVILRTGILDRTPLSGHENTIAMVVLVYVVYSWVWPPLLGRLQR